MLKKITFSSLFLLFSLVLFSQKSSYPFSNFPKGDSTLYIYPTTFEEGGCADLEAGHLHLFYDEDEQPGGYTTGTNTHLDQAFAQRYIFSDYVNVIGFMAGIYRDSTHLQTINLKACLWETSAGGIGSEMSILNFTTEDLDEGFSTKIFTFSSPVPMEDFAVGITVPEYRDNNPKLALSATAKNCASGERSYLLTNINTIYRWKTFHEIYSGEEFDLFLFPLVEISDPATIENFSADQLTVIYPVPAHSVLQVASSVGMEKVEIFTLQGKLIYSELTTEYSTGINISDFGAGCYVIQIYTPVGISTKKFTVNSSN